MVVMRRRAIKINNTDDMATILIKEENTMPINIEQCPNNHIILFCRPRKSTMV